MTDVERGQQTRAVHAGEAPDPVTGASAPNIVMSTTFVTDEPAGFSINAFEGERPYIYSRWGNPTISQLELKLAAFEDAEACLAFGSGMAATSALLLSSLSAGDHLVMSDVNYAGTAEFARTTLPRFGIDVSFVDTSDPDAVTDAMRAATKMVWIETPTNPILRLTDIRAIAKVAHAGDALLAVDSTFATPIATQPVNLGADFVVHSLTKYIGGHGDALGGAVLGSRAHIDALMEDALVHHGGVMSPFNAWLIMRGAATLPLRMRAHAAGALAVAQFLETHPAVTRTLYPGLASHPQHALATKQMRCGSGMISFQVNDGPAMAQRLATTLEVIHYAVSLGHQRSLIYWIPTDEMMATTFKLSPQSEARYRSFAGDGVFRLSVGLEDADDLIRDLDRAFGS